MTREEFCIKWRHGWKKTFIDGTQAFFYTEEQMKNDLDKVICSEVVSWKKFVDAACERSVDLDEWHAQEAAAIERRRQ